MAKYICKRCFGEIDSTAGCLSDHAMMKNIGDPRYGKFTCNKCYNELYKEKTKREQERKELEKQKEKAEQQQERYNREQAERNQRERRERELDETLDWFPCSHCGSMIREDQRHHKLNGELICSECWKRLATCNSCGKKFVCDDLAKYLISNDGVKPVYIKDRRKVYKKINGVIRFEYLDTCPDCMPAIRQKNAVWFNAQKQAERQAIYEQNQQKKAISNQTKEASLLFMPILCIILGIIEYKVIDCSWSVIGISELALIICGFIFKTIFGWLGRIAAIALSLEIVFGIIISIVCWFAIDAFVNPLIICGVVSVILAMILEITGITRKYLDNNTIKELLRLS